jgi:hypothetical protein
MLLLRKELYFLLLPLFFIACTESEELPTLIPTAEFQSTLAKSVTPDSPRVTSTPLATTIPLPSVTPVLPTAEATSVIGSGVNITTPNEGTELPLSSEVIVGGLVHLGTEDDFSVTLHDASGTELARGNIQLNDFNSWQATITVPDSIGGTGEIRAIVRDTAGNVIALDNQPIVLAMSKDDTGRYLELYRPNSGYSAVAGYYLFFDGRAQFPVNNLLSISVWNENCSVQIARQSYRLKGSGYWQGFVVIPSETVGEICAVASFGEPETEDWREAQVKINVLPSDDEAAKGILIGNPPPNATIAGRKSLLVYGTAFNAPTDAISVSILLENGRLINEGVTSVDKNGYWELELFIPSDAIGIAQIKVIAGEFGEDNYLEDETMVTID